MSKIKEYSAIEAGLSELSKKYLVVHDVSTIDGYSQCKKDAKEVGKYRINLELKRKEIKGPALQKCKDIDEEAKRIQLEIAKIEDPLKTAYKAVDDEKKRKEIELIEKIELKIADIRDCVNKSISANSDEISKLIEFVDDIDCTNGFYQLTKEALIARNETLDYLNSALKQSIQQEIDKNKRIEQEKELEVLRKANEENEKIKADLEREKQDIEHQKQMLIQREDAEKRMAIAEKEAEKERLEAEKRAAENARLIEVERQKAEIKKENERIEKLEADKKHTGKVMGEIKEHLMSLCNINEKTAKSVVLALLKTDRITINY